MRKIYINVTLAIALGALTGGNKNDGNDATVLGKLTYDGNVKSIRTAVFSVESEENIDFYTFGFFDTSSMPSESNTTASGLYIDLSSNLFGKSIDITKTVTGETYWDYDVSPGFEGEEIFNAYYTSIPMNSLMRI